MTPRRAGLSLIFVSLTLVFVAACGPGVQRHDDDGGGGADGPPGGCTNGVTRCSGLDLQTCNSDVFVTTETCATACDDTLGCVVCSPGSGTCNGNVATECLPDGSGYADVLCDPVQGVTCDMKSGHCSGTCAATNLGTSYIGCEYYPTVTGQGVSNTFEFAVAVANTSSAVATVTIDEGALVAPLVFDVLPGAVGVQRLPWVESLKLANCFDSFGCPVPTRTAVLAPQGAFHLRSTQPVTVYQFSPLDYTNGLDFTYTNDASLLLPVNALTGNYVAAAYPYWPMADLPSLLTVTATADDTSVTITANAPVTAGGGAPAFPANAPVTLTLQRGDVVELPAFSGDLTGSVVAASKPVQVVGGHFCTNVPPDIAACDHLEESLFPVEALSKQYLVTAPAAPDLPNGKEEIIRVVAVLPNTMLTVDPPIPGLPSTLAGVGDFIEIPRTPVDYAITGDRKIMVVHYMEGQEAGGNTGDPAMTLAVPTDQYRTDYLFHAPTNYEVNYVNITAPTGVTVMLDGQPVNGFTPIGASGFSVVRLQLGNGAANDGNHTATSTEKFGITVYGYGQYTSYWYPGGLDLAEIPVE